MVAFDWVLVSIVVSALLAVISIQLFECAYRIKTRRSKPKPERKHSPTLFSAALAARYHPDQTRGAIDLACVSCGKVEAVGVGLLANSDADYAYRCARCKEGAASPESRILMVICSKCGTAERVAAFTDETVGTWDEKMLCQRCKADARG